MVRYAVPTIIALVVNALYNMVDQIFIGNGVGNAIFTTIVFGIVYTILVQIFLEPLCLMLGATEESISYCLGYGRPIALGFTFSAIAGSFTSIVRADGRANVSMIGMFVPTMLILSLSGDVLKVLWTGPISDGGSCLISIIVLIVCWKGLFKKDSAKDKK